jgi:hypothetical protein
MMDYTESIFDKVNQHPSAMNNNSSFACLSSPTNNIAKRMATGGHGMGNFTQAQDYKQPHHANSN